MDEHWGAGLFTRVWPVMILLFIFNLSIFSTVLSLPEYPCPTLEEAFSDYAGETLLDEASQSGLFSRLVQKDEKTVRLITAQKHFLFDRYRFLEMTGVNGNYIQHNEEDYSLFVNFHSTTRINQYQASSPFPMIPDFSILWSSILLAFELILWFVVRKIRS